MGVVEEQRKWVESFFDDPGLTAGINEFQPKMLFVDSSGKVRACFFPDIDGPAIDPKMMWAVECISKSIPDLQEIVFAYETWGATKPKADGTEWTSEGFQYAVEHHTEDAPSVVEVLNAVGVAPGGTTWYAAVKYTRRATVERDQIIPEDGWQVEEADPTRGPLPMFLSAMAAEKTIEVAREALPEAFKLLGEDVINLRSLIAAVKVIGKETGCVCAIGTDSDEEAAIISEAFSGEGFHVHRFTEEGETHE